MYDLYKRNTRIVDKHVKPLVNGKKVLKHCLDLLLVGHVCTQKHRTIALHIELFLSCNGCRLVIAVIEHNLVTAL